VTRTHLDKSICVESAKLGEQDAMHGPVNVAAGTTARLDVTLSRDCGEIKARVVRDAQPVPDAKVLLLLSGSPKQPDDLLTDFADELGESSFTGLAPGRYRLWAWHVDLFGSFVGPAKLEGTEGQSTVVELRKGQHVTIDVPLLTQESGYR